MDSNLVGTLAFSVMPIVVAIISAIIMRVRWERFTIGAVLLCILFGILWPITLVGGAAYLASGLFHRIINAK